MEKYAEGSREAFRATIDKLKEIAQQQGVVVTDVEIAENLGITVTQFGEFYNNDWAPEELFPLLREKYHRFIGTLSITHFWFTDMKEVEDPTPDSEDDNFE